MSPSPAAASPIGLLLRRQAPGLALVALLSLLLAASTLAGQSLYRTVFDVLLPTRDPGVLRRVWVVLGGVALASLTANVGTSVLTRAFRSRFARDLRAAAVDRTLALPVLHLQEQTPGIVFQRLIPDLDALALAAGHLVTAASCAVQLAVILAVLGWTDAWVALIASAMIALHVLTSARLAPALHAALARRNAWVERRSAFSLSVLPAVKDIKSLGLHQRFLDEHAGLSRDARRDVLVSGFWESFAVEGSALPARIAALGVFAVGFAAVSSGRHTPGTVMTLVANAGALVWPLSALFRALTAARVEWPGAERARAHLRAAPEPSGARPVRELREGIRIARLRFSYPRTATPVLDDLSVEFPAGSFTAVTGTSGSGKTTLLDLILKLHPCPRGSITVDGIDLADLHTVSLRRSFAGVPQEPLLFTGSLRSNIDPHDRLSEEELRALCRALELETLVKSQRAGLDAPVGESGANLSGGERQRIGLARALARGPRVLVLDEATAALDANVEHRVIQVLADWLAAHRGTIIAVTHSPAMVRAADRVVRLERGRIAAAPALGAGARVEGTGS